MNPRTFVGIRYIMISSVMFALLGCSAAQRRQTQLARVANDWAMTIRASQVIPVYPLTEDLQPGDVFLVPVTIHDQPKQYRENGFLPLDQLITRLQTSTEFDAFYADAYLRGYATGRPHVRPEAAEPDPNAHGAMTGRYEMARMPAAAFPSYSFDVSAEQGLRIAVPVQGIPLGLGLLNTDAASGTVLIRDAFTYALPGDILLRRLHAWANEPDIQSELVRIKHSAGDRRVYLRTVNRIYLVGGVDVLLTAAKAGGGGLDADAAQHVNLLSARTEDMQRLKSNAQLLKDVQTALAGSMDDVIIDAAGNLLPGGSVQVAYASNRSVALREGFNRLLSIGYLGFDVEVLPGGDLGPPVSTLYRLTGKASRAIDPEHLPKRASVWSRQALRSIYLTLSAAGDRGDPDARAIAAKLDALANLLPEKYDLQPFKEATPGKPPDADTLILEPVDLPNSVSRRNFYDLIEYWSTVDAICQTLTQAANPRYATLYKQLDETQEKMDWDPEQRQEYAAAAQTALDDLESTLHKSTVLQDATSYWQVYYSVR